MVSHILKRSCAPVDPPQGMVNREGGNCDIYLNAFKNVTTIHLHDCPHSVTSSNCHASETLTISSNAIFLCILDEALTRLGSATLIGAIDASVFCHADLTYSLLLMEADDEMIRMSSNPVLQRACIAKFQYRIHCLCIRGFSCGQAPREILLQSYCKWVGGTHQKYL